MITSKQKPVLIVGAGPVGLSLALALIQEKIPVVVFEALTELSGEIRASTFHPATLEMFGEWEILDQILSQGQIVNRLDYWERETREKIATFDYQLIGQDTPYPYRLQLPQSQLTRALLPLIASSPYAEVYFAHQFTAFDDHGDYVEASFQTATGLRKFSGSYLCAADGSKSTVRKQLRLKFEGMTYTDRFLLIGTDLNLQPFYPDIGQVNYMYDPREWVIILHLPDIVRIVFRMRDDEIAVEAMQEPAVRRRIANFLGEDAPYAIFSITNYNVHQRVAEKFRVGRALLLGDAAHINNPSGGMGMNSGIHDAHFLAPRLKTVLGGGDTAVLDEYSDKRREVALQLIRQYSDKNYRDLVATTPQERAERNERMLAMASDPQKARAYLLKASMLADRI